MGGTGSGVGKTSITLGVVAALRKRGLKVQTFKVGPDFLDPSYLTIASGRTCYNLDSWMSSPEYVRKLFAKATADADIAIIEGVMGLFDGASPTALTGSTAEIASLIDSPVVLIANAHGAARSFAAMVAGFTDFEEQVNIAAVIANHSGSERHRDWLSESLAGANLPPLVGAVKRNSLPQLPSRHLGLVTADKNNLSEETIAELADRCEEYIDVDAILETASQAKPFEAEAEKPATTPGKIRIGIARDAAFHFYYPDNIEALERCGCEIVNFSPLNDKTLPEALDAIYLGGGYPEENAKALAANENMLRDVHKFAGSGGYVYAECGGLMYLGEKLTTRGSEEYQMAGVLPIATQMLERFKSLGYVEAKLTQDCIWGKSGDRLRGHEFHYSELSATGNDSDWSKPYEITRRSGSAGGKAGFMKNNIMASYVHLHFAGNSQAVKTFVENIKGQR